MTTEKRSVYFDHAASTPTDARVVEVMLPFFSDNFGNPSALYTTGRRAKVALDGARADIASVLNCSPEELIFTASGTESDNLALFGVARAHEARGKHILVSPIEHHAVLSAAEVLGRQGWDVTSIPVDEFGRVSPDDVGALLTPETTLVSVMLANNEIGTIAPIAKIARVIQQYKQSIGRSRSEAPFLHTDACQATCFLDIDVQKLGVDLLTLNGSKMYGPKGVGCLYVRRGVRLKAQVVGGGQESRRRSGTENVPGILGMAAALKIASDIREEESARLVILRDRLTEGILELIPKVVLNGHPTDRLPNNVNVSILDIEGEAALLYLDAHGIAAATGSACDSITLDPSHVILAIGRPYEFAHASMRFTLGRDSTQEDVGYLLSVLPGVVERLRAISPVRLELDAKKSVGSGASKETARALVGARPHWESKEYLCQK
jgi:cysteine desulfurase